LPNQLFGAPNEHVAQPGAFDVGPPFEFIASGSSEAWEEFASVQLHHPLAVRLFGGRQQVVAIELDSVAEANDIPSVRQDHVAEAAAQMPEMLTQGMLGSVDFQI